MSHDNEAEDFLQYELRGRVAYLTLNRPKQLNALCWPLMAKLESTLKELERDTKRRCHRAPRCGPMLLFGLRSA